MKTPIPKQRKKKHTSPASTPSQAAAPSSMPAARIAQLQQTIGNRATMQLLKSRVQPIQAYWLKRDGNITWEGTTDNPPEVEQYQKTGETQWKYAWLPSLLNVNLDVWERRPEPPPPKKKQQPRNTNKIEPNPIQEPSTSYASTITEPRRPSKPPINELTAKEMKNKVFVEMAKKKRQKNETDEVYIARVHASLLRIIGSEYTIDEEGSQALHESISSIVTAPVQADNEATDNNDAVQNENTRPRRTYSIDDLARHQSLSPITLARIQERIDAYNNGENRFSLHIGVGNAPSMDVTGTEFGGSGRGDVRLLFREDNSLLLVNHKGKSLV